MRHVGSYAHNNSSYNRLMKGNQFKLLANAYIIKYYNIITITDRGSLTEDTHSEQSQKYIKLLPTVLYYALDWQFQCLQ